jgi:hypothetical protein
MSDNTPDRFYFVWLVSDHLGQIWLWKWLGPGDIYFFSVPQHQELLRQQCGGSQDLGDCRCCCGLDGHSSTGL